MIALIQHFSLILFILITNTFISPTLGISKSPSIQPSYSPIDIDIGQCPYHPCFPGQIPYPGSPYGLCGGNGCSLCQDCSSGIYKTTCNTCMPTGICPYHPCLPDQIPDPTAPNGLCGGNACSGCQSCSSGVYSTLCNTCTNSPTSEPVPSTNPSSAPVVSKAVPSSAPAASLKPSFAPVVTLKPTSVPVSRNPSSAPVIKDAPSQAPIVVEIGQCPYHPCQPGDIQYPGSPYGLCGGNACAQCQGCGGGIYQTICNTCMPTGICPYHPCMPDETPYPNAPNGLCGGNGCSGCQYCSSGLYSSVCNTCTTTNSPTSDTVPSTNPSSAPVISRLIPSSAPVATFNPSSAPLITSKSPALSPAVTNSPTRSPLSSTSVPTKVPITGSNFPVSSAVPISTNSPISSNSPVSSSSPVSSTQPTSQKFTTVPTTASPLTVISSNSPASVSSSASPTTATTPTTTSQPTSTTTAGPTSEAISSLAPVVTPSMNPTSAPVLSTEPSASTASPSPSPIFPSAEPTEEATLTPSLKPITTLIPSSIPTVAQINTINPTSSNAVQICLNQSGKYYVDGIPTTNFNYGQFTVRQIFSNVLNHEFSISNTQKAFNKSILCALESKYLIAPVSTVIYNVSFIKPNELQFFYSIKFKFPLIINLARRSLVTTNLNVFQDFRVFYGNLTQNFMKPYTMDGRFIEVYNEYCGNCLSGAVYSNITFGPLILDTPATSKAPSYNSVTSSNSSQDNTQIWLGVGLGVGLCVLIFVNLLLISFCLNGATPFKSDIKIQKEVTFTPDEYIAERSFDARGSNADSVSVNDSEAFGVSMEGSNPTSRAPSRHTSNAEDYGVYPSDDVMRTRALTDGSELVPGTPSNRTRQGSHSARLRTESLSRPRGPSISLAPGLPTLPERDEDVI